MKFDIVGYRLLVKPDAIETKTESGLFLVVNEKMEKLAQQYGYVVSIGDACWQGAGLGDKPWVSVGDRVLYAKNVGRLIVDPDTGDEFVILNDQDVLARVSE